MSSIKIENHCVKVTCRPKLYNSSLSTSSLLFYNFHQFSNVFIDTVPWFFFLMVFLVLQEVLRICSGTTTPWSTASAGASATSSLRLRMAPTVSIPSDGGPTVPSQCHLLRQTIPSCCRSQRLAWVSSFRMFIWMIIYDVMELWIPI